MCAFFSFIFLNFGRSDLPLSGFDFTLLLPYHLPLYHSFLLAVFPLICCMCVCVCGGGGVLLLFIFTEVDYCFLTVSHWCLITTTFYVGYCSANNIHLLILFVLCFMELLQDSGQCGRWCSKSSLPKVNMSCFGACRKHQEITLDMYSISLKLSYFSIIKETHISQ